MIKNNESNIECDKYEKLSKKIHCLQRTKLRLKNNLNCKIIELDDENKNLKKKNKELEEKLQNLDWAESWDNIENNLEPDSERWPFDQKFYLILNLAIGGEWGGQHGIDVSMFPVQMKVDYVKVYQYPCY